MLFQPLYRVIALLLILLSSNRVWATTNQKSEFVVLTQTFNSSHLIERYFYSLSLQKYPKWECIFINDGSTDDTALKVQESVRKYKLNGKVTVINNATHRGLIANMSSLIRRLSDKKIIVLIDDTAILSHTDIFEKLASTYADPNVWMTYGYYETAPRNTDSSSICKPFPEYLIAHNHLIRKYTWISPRIRSFYAKLFQSISDDDLKLNGQYIDTDDDRAAIIPMLEMSTQRHIGFIPEAILLYNMGSARKETPKKAIAKARLENHIRSKPPYKPLIGHLFNNSDFGKDKKK